MQSTQYIIGIVGVRDFQNVLYENNSYIVRTIERHILTSGRTLQSISVVTGGGRGVERMIVEWCEAKDIPCRKIPPNIAEYGPKKAFAIRNNNIVSQSNELVVFWDGCIDVTKESIATAMHLSRVATCYPVI